MDPTPDDDPSPTDPARLELSPDTMRALGYRAVDLLVEHLTTLPDQPAGGVPPSRAELDAALREPPPAAGSDPEAVLERVAHEILPARLRVDHPRFFAYVPGPSNYVSALADFLASGFNVFAGSWQGAAGAAATELVVVDWLRDAMGFPESAGGLFVSGGSVANLTALAAARHARGAGPDAVIYTSDQTHSAIPKALRTLGFAPEALRVLPSDEAFRLEPGALAAAVWADRAAGRVPFCVIANAGTTSTGAVDPLPALAELCEAEGLWLHVDGAYGAAAALCERGRAALAGIERADSLALDPHKWLFQPFEAGLVLVRDGGHLRAAFDTSAEYLRDAEGYAGGEGGEVNYFTQGIQLTRSFRALKVWMSLQTFGLDAFRAAVARGFDLAEHAERRLRAHPRWEMVSPATMGIVAFRHLGHGVRNGDRLGSAELDDLARRLAAELAADGFAMVSTTELRGRTVLRLCTINPRATEDDIDATLEKLDDLAREASGAGGA